MLRISQVGVRSGTFSEHSGVDHADKLAAVGYDGDSSQSVAFDQDAGVCDRVLSVNKMPVCNASDSIADRYRSPSISRYGLQIIEHQHPEKSAALSNCEGTSPVHREDLVNEPLDGQIG